MTLLPISQLRSATKQTLESLKAFTNYSTIQTDNGVDFALEFESFPQSKDVVWLKSEITSNLPFITLIDLFEVTHIGNKIINQKTCSRFSVKLVSTKHVLQFVLDSLFCIRY